MRATLIGCLALVAACGGTTAPRDTSVFGTYDLVAMDGKPLPWTPPVNPPSVAAPITSGYLTLRDDLTYSMGFNNDMTSVDTGSWTVSGTTFTWLSNAMYSVPETGTLASGQITLPASSDRLVSSLYVKR